MRRACSQTTLTFFELLAKRSSETASPLPMMYLTISSLPLDEATCRTVSPSCAHSPRASHLALALCVFLQPRTHYRPNPKPFAFLQPRTQYSGRAHSCGRETHMCTCDEKFRPCPVCQEHHQVEVTLGARNEQCSPPALETRHGKSTASTHPLKIIPSTPPPQSFHHPPPLNHSINPPLPTIPSTPPPLDASRCPCDPLILWIKPRPEARRDRERDRDRSAPRPDA
jgi:hypothetical protein